MRWWRRSVRTPAQWWTDAIAAEGRHLRPFAALLAANLLSVTGNALTELGVPWFVLATSARSGEAGRVSRTLQSF